MNPYYDVEVQRTILENIEEFGEAGEVDDQGDDHVRDVLVESRRRQVAAAHVQVADEQGYEDDRDGVIAAQQGCGDAVEAVVRKGRIGAVELELDARVQVVEGAADGSQAAGDGHGQDDVPLLVHPDDLPAA